MRVMEWLVPLRDIAGSLRRLVELKELEMQAHGYLTPPGEAMESEVYYQDDLALAQAEQRRLEWMARGGPPIWEGEAPPGVPGA